MGPYRQHAPARDWLRVTPAHRASSTSRRRRLTAAQPATPSPPADVGTEPGNTIPEPTPHQATPGPTPQPQAAATGTRRARRARLTAARINPWSALKTSFLLSVGWGLAEVGLTAALWLALSAAGIFSTVQAAIDQTLGSTSSKLNLMHYVGFSQVLSLSIVIAVATVVLVTAIATAAAGLYNLTASLVGGLNLTLLDD